MEGKSKFLKKLPIIISVVIGVFAVTFFVIKFLWAWTIPDLFPGAVEQGLVATEISWLTSFKLALFFGLLTGAVKANSK